MRILVVADDITGAAEMAGIAHRMGCRVAFATSPDRLTDEADVTVIATDTRSMSRSAALDVTRKVVTALRTATEPLLLFKKTDSALRGHIVAELRGLMDLGYDRALLLAANPSKGRCIDKGIYTIAGTPIDQTTFRTDPEFPALTARAVELVGGDAHYATNPAIPLRLGISIGESRTTEEVARWVAAADEGVLLAGAADAFESLLRREGYRTTERPAFEGLAVRRTLIVLGSTVRHDLTHEPFFARNRVGIAPMPDAVFAGEEPTGWIEKADRSFAANESLLLRIPQAVEVDGGRALHLRRAMAVTAAAMIEKHRPAELVIEGGASAYALLDRLGWHTFTVTNEIAAGVVRLHHPESGTHLTFKPGSYAWGTMFS